MLGFRGPDFSGRMFVFDVGVKHLKQRRQSVVISGDSDRDVI